MCSSSPLPSQRRGGSGPVSEESCAPLMIVAALVQELQLILALGLVVEPLLEIRGVLVQQCSHPFIAPGTPLALTMCDKYTLYTNL
ncbi:UNVERIFIED_CONTAM: hypothetical protein FKN15_067216 [Acipenser sinensis]